MEGFGAGFGAGCLYLWLTDPDADPGGPKTYGSNTAFWEPVKEKTRMWTPPQPGYLFKYIKHYPNLLSVDPSRPENSPLRQTWRPSSVPSRWEDEPHLLLPPLVPPPTVRRRLWSRPPPSAGASSVVRTRGERTSRTGRTSRCALWSSRTSCCGWREETRRRRTEGRLAASRRTGSTPAQRISRYSSTAPFEQLVVQIDFLKRKSKLFYFSNTICINLFTVTRVSDPDPHGSALIWVAGSGSGSAFKLRTRIQEGKNDPQK